MVLPVFQSTAAQGFFSRDGKTVTLIHGNKLGQVDIASGQYQPIPLPGELGDAYIVSVATGAPGETWLLTNEAVWVMKDGADPQQVCSTAPLEGPHDLFVITQADSPMKDWIVVSAGKTGGYHGTNPTFHARKPGDESFGSIFCRRVQAAEAGYVAADGRFFFTSAGDVWEGRIEATPGDQENLAELLGARIAPLAMRDTDASYGGLGGVEQVATAGRWLYAKLRGRHVAAIVRTQLPPKPNYEAVTVNRRGMQQKYQSMQQSLSKVEILTVGDDMAGFCVCEVKGKPRLFYAARIHDQTNLMLVDGSGAPRVIGHIDEPHW